MNKKREKIMLVNTSETHFEISCMNSHEHRVCVQNLFKYVNYCLPYKKKMYVYICRFLDS